MRLLRNAWFLGLVCLAAVFPASAQMGMMNLQQPDWRGIFNPVIGSGASYDVQNSNDKMPIDITVVGKDDSAGKPGYWLEFGMTNPKMGGQMFMKYLFTVDGKNGVISHTIVQMPGRPPMDLGGMMTAMRGDQKLSTDIHDQAVLVGTEDVNTPAGTFNCEHYRAMDGSWNAWVSTKVTPWGLVKYVGHADTMTLNHVITDAKDQITGTPQKFDPSQMMRGRTGQ